MRKIIILAITFFCIFNVEGQLLKKLKEKVNKTVDNVLANDGKPSSEGAIANPKVKDQGANINSEDNININTGDYTLAYSSPINFRIMYDESRLGIGRNKSDYRLILKQSIDNKTQFIIIDNGQVSAKLSSLTDDQVIGGLQQPLDGLNGSSDKTKLIKYIVPETTSVKVQKQDSKTVTAPKKIDGDKVVQGFEMVKNTDEYKKMSPEEKKELEETMKQIPQAAKDYNSSELAGKTISTPEVKGGTYTWANGYYKIIIKGKDYGRFSGQPILNISNDDANVYIVATDDKGKSYFIANDKKTLLTSKDASYMGHSGSIITSPDGKKAVFIELKTLSEKEFEDRNKLMESGGQIKNSYIITKSDGNSSEVVRTDGGDKFKLINSGALVYLDQKTREVLSDGKPIGKFSGNAYPDIIADGLLVGTELSKICYYMDDGSLTYLDGTQKKMGIIFPQIITDNGKTYLTWFKKSKNDIYIGKFEF